MQQRGTDGRCVLCGMAGALALVGVLLAPAAVRAQDRHVGYYYPQPQTMETYEARADTLPDSDSTRRIGFVVELIGGQSGIAGQQLGGQPRVGRERRLDALHREPADPRLQY